MDGFTLMKMEEAAPLGDIFITVTGCCDVINKEHFLAMKDGAILCNAGHFDVEVDVKALKELAIEAREMRHNIVGYQIPNGNWLHLIAEGRLVNLAAGDGHPAEIMDMSFAIQALSAKYLADNRDMKFDEMLIAVPREIDLEVARRALGFWGCGLDKLTNEQERYLYQ